MDATARFSVAKNGHQDKLHDLTTRLAIFFAQLRAENVGGETYMNRDDRCPRCEGVLKSWAQLTEDEQAIVKRLPESADYTRAEREKLHQWCTRCWYELTTNPAERA